MTIWIGQNGERRGPYSEADVRQWLTEGKFTADVLAWRDGMADWAPVHTLFPDITIQVPPPIAAPMPPAFSTDHANGFAGGTAAGSFSASHDHYASAAADREAMPPPPSMHWGVLLLLMLVTLGLFGIVWPFVQANWVRKVDRQSKAMLLLSIGVVCLVVGEILNIDGMLHRPGGAGTSALGGLLVLTNWILLLVAYFSMADSTRRAAASHDVTMQIGGVTLFFFTCLYFQGQLHWLARWRSTGQTTPKPPKAVFWLLWLFIPLTAILAAIAIPAYQGYLIRTQVTEGLILAQRAEIAVDTYYKKNGQLPTDNAAAGLSDSTSMNGKYVSSVDVSGGSIVIAYGTPMANRLIRDKELVFTPDVRGSSIAWNCNADSTVPSQYLPLTCRNH